MANYKGILRSTTWVGGANALNILVAVVRTKVFAFILGPYGIGVLGLYQSIIDVMKNCFIMGVHMSGVKFIAERNTDTVHRNQVISFILYIGILLGILGFSICFIFSKEISYYTFASYEYTNSIRLLSISVFFLIIYQVGLAILQGLREIKAMAFATFIAPLVSVFISIPFVIIFREKSIVCVLLFNSFVSFITILCVIKKNDVSLGNIELKNFLIQSVSVIRLGIMLTLTASFATLSLYIIRQYILEKSSMEMVGLFQASWTLSTVYVGVILSAMAADYFPKLTAVSKSIEQIYIVSNESITIALLVGGPLVLLLCALMSVVIKVLYSSAFLGELLMFKLMLLGTIPKLASTFFGYILLVRNDNVKYIISSANWYISFLLFSFVLWNIIGLYAIGISYIIASYLDLCCNFILCKYSLGHVLYGLNIRLLLVLGLIGIAVVFWGDNWLYSVLLIGIAFLYILFEVLNLCHINNYKKLKEKLWKRK